MSLLSKGHPVGFLFHREFNNVRPSLDSIVDASFEKAKNFYRKNLLAHYGCVNAIEFSDDGRLLVSGGDDRRVLVWDMQKAIHSCMEPIAMTAEHTSNIFALAVDYRCSRIFSGGNDDQVIVHDAVTGTCLDYFVHEQPVYGISTDPRNDNVFASACDDGRILVYDIREPSVTEPFCLATTTAAFHSVVYNPSEPRLLVSANFKKGIALWDIRMPKRCLLKYGGSNSNQCCMSARFNRNGSRILALRKRLPPVLYSADSTVPIFQFNNTGYYNSCTMKSCCFAGSNDEFVMSGSDNFDLYVWKIPSTVPRAGSSGRYVRNAHLVLQGHRSIVNQVRYNHTYSVIASSGVEKLIKLWSPFSLPSSHDGRSSYKLRGDTERHIYSHDDYINLIMHSGQFMSLTYDTSRRNTREDPRMMAFFDALVQRDITGMSDEEGPAKKVSYTNTAISFSSSSSNNGDDEPDPEPEQGGSDEGESHNELVGAEIPNPTNPLSRSFVSTASSTSSEDEDEAMFNRIRREQEVLFRTENGSNTPEIGPQPPSPSSDSDEESSSDPGRHQSNPVVVMPNDNSVGESSSDSGKHISNQQSAGNSASVTPPMNDDESEDATPRPQSNIITRMIAAKNDQLLNLAKAHMVEEYDRKAALRRLKRAREDKSSSSSASSSSSTTSNEASSTDSEIDDMFANLKKKIKPFLWKKKHPDGKGKQGSTNQIRNLINKYNDKSNKKLFPRHESPSSHNGVTNGRSPADDNRPCTSSSLTYNSRLNPPACKSVPSYSKASNLRNPISSSSSDSESSVCSPPVPGPSRKKSRNHSFEVSGKKCDKAADDERVSRSSSTSSEIDSANEDESSLQQSSLAYRISPLIRRIDSERRKQLTKRSKRTGTGTSSSDTDRGVVPRKKLRNNTNPNELKMSGKEKNIKTDSEYSSEGTLTNENDVITGIPSALDCETTLTSAVGTHDSGIELSRNELEQEIDDAKSSTSSSTSGQDEDGKAATASAIRSLICRTDLDLEEKEKTPCAFKRNEVSKTKNRHYRGHRQDSD